MVNKIIAFFSRKNKPQNPDYHGPHGELYRRMDINRDAGRLVVAI